MAQGEAGLIIRAVDATRAGFNAAEAGARRFAGNISGIMNKLGLDTPGLKIAALGVALGKVVLDGIEFGDTMQKAATRAGVAVDQFTRLAFAAQQADIESESLSKALQKMQIGLANTGDNSGELFSELGDLSLKIRDIRSLRPDQQFLAFADAISKVKDPADKARIAVAVFGKAGGELIPFFDQGAAAILEAANATKVFGLELDAISAGKLTAADDELKKLVATFKGYGIAIATALAPAVTTISSMFRDIVGAQTELEVITKKIELLDEARTSIPIFFNFGYIDGAPVFMGPQELAKQLDILTAKKKELEKAGSGVDPATNTDVLVADLQALIPKDPFGPLTANLTKEASAAIQKGILQGLEGVQASDETYRLEQDIFGSLSRRDDRDDAISSSITRNAELIQQLNSDVAEGVATQTGIAEESTSQAFDRMAEKVTGTSDIMKGALLAIGASIEQNISATLLAAGDGAGAFKDRLLQAFKQILADLATKKLIESLAALGGSLKGSSGIAGAIGAGLSALFGGAQAGGAKAGGGPLDPGKWYVAGEKGAEPIWGGGPGAFAVGYGQQAAMGGGGVNVVVNQVNNVDMRGATKEGSDNAMQQLPALFKRNNDQVKADIRDAINRGQFGLK